MVGGVRATPVGTLTTTLVRPFVSPAVGAMAAPLQAFFDLPCGAPKKDAQLTPIDGRDFAQPAPKYCATIATARVLAILPSTRVWSSHAVADVTFASIARHCASVEGSFTARVAGVLVGKRAHCAAGQLGTTRSFSAAVRLATPTGSAKAAMLPTIRVTLCGALPVTWQLQPGAPDAALQNNLPAVSASLASRRSKPAASIASRQLMQASAAGTLARRRGVPA